MLYLLHRNDIHLKLVQNLNFYVVNKEHYRFKFHDEYTNFLYEIFILMINYFSVSII